MDDMRFHPSAGGTFDPILSEFLDFLRQLPEDGDAQDEAVVTPRRQTQHA
jgi:hypothetical protein